MQCKCRGRLLFAGKSAAFLHAPSLAAAPLHSKFLKGHLAIPLA